MFVIKKNCKYLSKDCINLTGTIKEANLFTDYKSAKIFGDKVFNNNYEICEVELFITKNYYISSRGTTN